MEESTITAVEDTEMEDCDGQKVVTMMDVLKEQEDFENNANAVLGASDEKNCTYSKGYIKRQAIYACMTCCTEAKDDASKRAGVCLACSLMCHESHELIELYTKRNFRCDCGNPKFNGNPCQYTTNKTDLNENNEYNQNFSGLYCICHRPYPDPESTLEDEMIQCIICEDWLHASHLDATVPSNDQYSEMICKECMEKKSFLHDYSSLAVNGESDVNIVVNISEISKINGNEEINQLNKTESGLNEILEKCTEKENNTNLNNSSNEETIVPLKEKSMQELEYMITSPDKNVENSNVINTAIIPEKEVIDTTKEKTKIEDEHMEEDRLLADPEENINELTNKKDTLKDNEIDQDNPENENNKNDISQSDTINDILMHKEQNQQPTEDVPINETDASATNGDVINNTNSETKKDVNIIDETSSLEISAIVPSSIVNKNNEMDMKLITEAAVVQTVDKTIIEAKNLMDNNLNTNLDTDEKNEIIQPNDLENAKDSDPKIAEENEINIINDTDMTTEIINEDTNKLGDATCEYKRKLSIDETIIEDSNEAKRVKVNSSCNRPKKVKKIYKGATFWPSDFRQKLCTCNECLTMYKDLSVLFLTDFEDTVTAYESLGEEKERIEGKPPSQYEKGLQALSSLDRIQQINALTEYNKMKDKLLDFLKTFKDKKEVVKEEDIKEFFAGMKPKREPDGVYFCR